MRCKHLIETKGNGDDWCTKHRGVADCEDCEREAAKALRYARAYGSGIPADAACGRSVTGRFLRADAIPRQKTPRTWYGRAIQRLRAALKEHRPSLGLRPHQREALRNINTAVLTNFAVQEQAMLALMRSDYESLVVRHCCPACDENKGVLRGPEAGSCLNVKCNGCGAKFWVNCATHEAMRTDD